MHTTTSWSSPPPAWRVWEAWGRKHSVWSSAHRHGARRVADTHSPVPASYCRRSGGGGRNTETDARQRVWRFAFRSFPRPARRNTEAARTAERRLQQENAGKGPKCLCSALTQALEMLLCVWRLALAHLAAGPSAKCPIPCRRIPNSLHTQAGAAVWAAWVSRRRLEAFLAPVLLTGVKTKLFTLYQPIIFVCEMRKLLTGLKL